jgi:hypothetical protein
MQTEILPFYEGFYIESMFFDADIAVGVLEEIEQRELPNGWLRSVAQRGFLAYLQIFVQHSAAISRYFWPVRRPHELRGEQLRQVFGVTDSSPLKSRELRNALEHLDERLDVFLEQNPIGHFLPEFVGPMPDHASVPQHFFRAYFPDEKVFELLGLRYAIQPLADEVIRIHKLLFEMRKLGRF